VPAGPSKNEVCRSGGSKAQASKRAGELEGSGRAPLERDRARAPLEQDRARAPLET
jgi:hypothetical protein